MCNTCGIDFLSFPCKRKEKHNLRLRTLLVGGGSRGGDVARELISYSCTGKMLEFGFHTAFIKAKEPV